MGNVRPLGMKHPFSFRYLQMNYFSELSIPQTNTMEETRDTETVSFEDQEHYKTWLRFKEAAGKENSWMRQRLGWMLAGQAALFALYGLDPAFFGIDQTHHARIEKSLPVVGVMVSLIGFIGTLAAAQMHWLWTSNMNSIVDHLEELHGDKGKGILSFGSRPRWAARSTSISPPAQAYIFLSFWTFICAAQLKVSMNEWAFAIVAFLVFVIAIRSMVLEAQGSLWSSDRSYAWEEPEAND